MSLRGKKILITAGPTWVPIDSVRIISNVATGKTGVLLAREAIKQGARPTLFLGPVRDNCIDESIRVRRFKFFDELRDKIKRELHSNRYDVIIHNAAVSDFGARQFKGKINSRKTLDLKLKPLPKIINDIQYLAPYVKLVMFKLESNVSDKILIKRAKEARAKARADFIVANRFNPYRAYIIDAQGNQITAKSRQELAKKLIKILLNT